MGLVLFSTLITSSGQILLKTGANRLAPDVVSILLNFPLILGLIFYMLGAAILLFSLKHGELSVLYPIYATNFVWVSILSPMFFPSDSMNPYKWIGVFIILAGVSLVGYGSKTGGGERGD